MKLIATILARNDEARIADAITSVVDWVDTILLIDTGVTDSTLSIAEAASNGKLVTRQFSWCEHYGMARNFALIQANALGADWALTVDCQERMEWPGYSNAMELKAALQRNETIRLWNARCKDGSLAKERIIRLPVGAQQHWCGEIFETFQGLRSDQFGILTGARFRVIDQFQETRRIEWEQAIVRLERTVANDPGDGQSWFGLGRA